MAEERECHRGDIFTVDLEPTRGSEQGKVRPVVIIQNDVGNKYSPTVIVAAITSGEESVYPVEVKVKSPEGGLRKDSLVLLNQIRTVDKERLGRYCGRLSPVTMQRVDEAIKISLGLIPL